VAASDTMTKSCIMNLMSLAMLRGTQTKTGDNIADSLGQLGSEFEVETTEDYSWFQVAGLSRYQDKLFDVFSDVILHPSFESKEVDREKKQIIAAIQERADHPEQFAEQAFQSYLFGAHPYAKPTYGMTSDVSTVKPMDLKNYYNDVLIPNDCILVVTGDFSSEQMKHVRSTFENWKVGQFRAESRPAPPVLNRINIRLIDKPDLTQSQIIIGHLGIKRSDPDYLALKIASLTLGGDFSSRLMSEVRVKRGLTYGISSSFQSFFDQGSFQISTFTKNQTVGETIRETIHVYEKFVKDGASDEEVEDAKNSLLGNFPRIVETSEHLGFNLALLKYYGVSDDYLQNFVSLVTRLSAKDINAAIKKHMNPEDLKILVLSKASEALPQVNSIGLVELKKIEQGF
jgi:zinc protease